MLDFYRVGYTIFTEAVTSVASSAYIYVSTALAYNI